ncbi:MAG: SufE family protein [Sphingobacteriales bacterium]|jgi:cysteine desulfuration protein SufE|nr:SufE family protein [Sphingobacteriales bacterium]
MEAIEQEIIDDFALFDTWEDKYQYIIELGQKLPVFNPEFKTDDYRIKGCQSSVWLDASYSDGRIVFYADSDSTFVKGEIALLMKVLSGRTPQEILDAKLEFIDSIGLRQHMAVTRANGLNAMVKQMKAYALAHSAN